MGGPGAASGVSNSGRNYGTEHITVLQVGDVKYLKSTTSNNAKLPMETKVAGRTYASIDEYEHIRSVGFYGNDGVINKRIDLSGGAHQGIPTPHAHDNPTNKRAYKARTLNSQEKNILNKIIKDWDRR